jgi:hypothetical protein
LRTNRMPVSAARETGNGSIHNSSSMIGLAISSGLFRCRLTAHRDKNRLL